MTETAADGQNIKQSSAVKKAQGDISMTSSSLESSGSSPLKATLVIIRHAEKHNWFQGLQPSEFAVNCYVDNHKLSGKGYERAQALVPYFKYREEMVRATNGKGFDYIISQAVDTGPDPFGESERPEETVKPFAEEMKLNLTKYTKKELSHAVSFIKSKKDATILVCWAHQMIPEIARMLGVPSQMVPEHWTGKRFDVTWVIKPASPHPTLTQYPQRLLYGDGEDVIPLTKPPKNKS